MPRYLGIAFDQVLRFFQLVFDWDEILDAQKTLLDTSPYRGGQPNELELQIPVFSSLFESITGGQNLTLRNLASLITALPTAVIGSALPSGSSMKRPTTTRRRELLTFESATPLLALPLALHSGELRAYAPDGTRVWSHR